jgi:hypothetical protein
MTVAVLLLGQISETIQDRNLLQTAVNALKLEFLTPDGR